MTIVRIELWNDVGYTESGVERPPVDAPAPTNPVAVFEVRPSASDLFSAFSVKAPYRDLMGVSYLRATYQFNNSAPLTVYGWVDGVGTKSDSDGYPNTEVYWHVDLWRTYNTQAEYKAGTVHRRPERGDVPPQPYPFRYRQVTSRRPLVPNMTMDGVPVWWVYLTYTYEPFDGPNDQTEKITSIRHLCWPVRTDDRWVYFSRGAGEPHRRGPSFSDVYGGKMDERFMIPPSTIVACAISPIPPVPMEGSGTQEDPYHLNVDDSRWEAEVVSDPYHAFRMYRLAGVIPAEDRTWTNPMHEFQSSLPSAVKTTDTVEYSVCGMDGSTVGVLPWGLSVRNYTYRMIDETTNFAIQVRFNGLNGNAEGLTFTLPLPMLPVTSNSWSEYAYTGLREYDKEVRNLQSLQNMVGGLTDSLGMGVQTTQMANLNTKWRDVTPTTRLLEDGRIKVTTGSQFRDNMAWNNQAMKTNIAKGAVAGLAQAGMAAVQGGLDYFYFNPEYQKWEDYKQANQPDNLVLGGQGTDLIFYGCPMSLVRMENDRYAVTQRNNDIMMYGVHVTEPMESCQRLVEAGGPLQITNMTVGGNIPVEAKEYIRMMFSNGVRLV